MVSSEEKDVERMRTDAQGFSELPLTEHELSPDQLRLRHQRIELERDQLERIFQMAPSFMCVLQGPDHIFVRANERYQDLLGGREILGKSVREAIPELEGQGFLEILDNVYRTGESFVGTNMSVNLRRGDLLEERTLEFVYQPMLDAAGAISGILAHGIDLTERKRAEAHLIQVTTESQRRRRLYETILASTPDFVYVFSLDHRVLYANEALEIAWGCGPQGAVGKTFLELGYESWHAELHNQEIDQVCSTKQPIRGEVPFSGTFGRRMYDYIFVPVFGADGEVEAVAGTTRDITERKEAEESLKETDRRKDEFIALLAHELRNPLAPIRNGLQVLRLAQGDPHATEEARKMMDRQLAHMVRLIDDLLDISRISQGKMELRLERILLEEAIADAVETARPVIDAAGHTLTIALPANATYLNADMTRLAQILSNLLTNSAKYTEHAGQIRLTAQRSSDSVEISVSDDGLGIPREALSRVFKMFSQVERTIERTSGGLGIGLALVKGLVEMHGGSVAAESDGPGFGSTFTVRLPAIPIEEEPRPSAVEDSGTQTPDTRRRILVVDDNRDSAHSMARLLELLGNEVRTAYDGTDAVEVAAEFRPEIILMDVGMPHMDGYEATRRIRAEDWGPEITIVALTGWGQESDRTKSQEAGCDNHLVKPVDFAELEKLLTGPLPRQRKTW